MSVTLHVLPGFNEVLPITDNLEDKSVISVIIPQMYR